MALIRYFLLFLLFPLTLAAQQGGAAETARRAALIRILAQGGIPYEERPLFAEYGGFGTSVHVVIPGGNAAETSVFVLAVPLWGEENSGEGLSYAMEGALAFIQKILSRGSGPNIRVAFLGDESSGLPEDMRKQTHRGLRDLYALVENPDNTLVLYLDLPEPPQTMVIHHGSRGSLVPLNILRSLPGLCRSCGIPYTFAVRFNGLYKLGLLDGPPALELAQTAGFPALCVTGRYAGTAAPAAGETLGDLLFEYANSLDLSGLEADTHYSIIQYGNRTVFISEPATVIVLSVLSALFLGILLVRFVLFRRRISWNKIPRCFLAAAFLGTIFFISFHGTAPLFAALLKRFAVSPDRLSYGGPALGLSIALALFSLGVRGIDFIEWPGRSRFYGNTALLLIALGMSAAAFMDITFIPTFAWAFLCAFPAGVSKKPLVIWGCVLLMPLPGALALANIVEAGNTRLLTMIFPARPEVSLFITLITLPFLLLFHRGLVLGRKRKIRPSYLAPPLILLALDLGGLVFCGYYLSKTPVSAPVRRTVREAGILDLALTERVLLERRIITLRIEAEGNPIRFDISLETKGALPVIYDTPMPFEYNRGSVEFLLGEGPPNPFTAEVVLPLDFSGVLKTEALYPVWDPALDPQPPPETADYVLRAVKTLPLAPSGLFELKTRLQKTNRH